MKLNGKHLDKYRSKHPAWGTSEPGTMFGYFRAKSPDGSQLEIISSGERHAPEGPAGADCFDTLGNHMSDWEHVSVSIRYGKVLPSWESMCFVKDLFWMPDECVVQFHPPESKYINVAQCLHLWKPPFDVILPPPFTLAPSGVKRL